MAIGRSINVMAAWPSCTKRAASLRVIARSHARLNRPSATDCLKHSISFSGVAPPRWSSCTMASCVESTTAEIVPLGSWQVSVPPLSMIGERCGEASRWSVAMAVTAAP